ncbi:SanA/YdcF family protein [Jongsikchunia kroppenstedtii]|uniref:SanA/YdcF family protein n=1 Tax=Jongsikchunia kroppenstedtii TaxID=1121721 RepID=UPI00037653AB|nr:YdcF family protein [Jongsikchunia kroppenstedtii]
MRDRPVVLVIGGAWAALVLTVTLGATVAYTASVGRIHDGARSSTLLVLGSKVSDGAPGNYVRGRLDTALRLYADGGVHRIVVSGNGRPSAGDEPAVMRDYLRERGVPDGLIAVDETGYDTSDSCHNLRSAGVRAATIVTQDFHLPRAIALCRHAGIAATGVEAGCPCAAWTVGRNYLREMLLSRPKMLVSLLG